MDLNRLQYSKKDLQADISIFGTDFKLQLSNNFNQINTYQSKKSIVYEETMMFCLDSMLDSLPYKNNKLVFFDIGAYIGYYASFVSKKLGDRADVFAIESNKLYLDNIEDTIKINGFDNLTATHEVLSSREEHLIVFEDMAVEEDSLKANKDKFQSYHEIKEADDILKKGIKKDSITLDNYCLKYAITPNIIKIDVHGAEGKVFLGANQVLKSGVDVIFLELHPQQLLDRYSEGITKKSILNQIQSSGFNTFIVSPFRCNEKTFEYKYFKENNKLLYVELTDKNQDDVLFDRNLADIFILCLRKEIKINDLNCF